MKFFTIGEASELLGISTETLRHYDRINLVKPKMITEAGHRIYSFEEIYKLSFVISLKNLNFSLKDIKTYMESSLTSKEILNNFQEIQLKIEKKIENLISTKNRLDDLIKKFKSLKNIEYDKFIIEHKTEISYEILEKENISNFFKSFMEILKENPEKFKIGELYNPFLEKEELIIFKTTKKENTYLQEGYYLTYFFKGSYEKLDNIHEDMINFLKAKNISYHEDKIIYIYHQGQYTVSIPEEYITEVRIPLKKLPTN